AARRRWGSPSPNTSSRLRISSVEMLCDMVGLLIGVQRGRGSDLDLTAVDEELDAVDEARLTRRQEQHRLGDLFGLGRESGHGNIDASDPRRTSHGQTQTSGSGGADLSFPVAAHPLPRISSADNARRDLRRQKTSVQERSSQTRAPSLQNCASGPPKNPYAMRRYRRRSR